MNPPLSNFDSHINKMKIYRDKRNILKDFGNNETELIELISDYLSEDVSTKLAENSGGIEYRYDWRLNDYQ